MKPYERSIARVRAMYGVPTPLSANRVLELCYERPSILSGYSWRGACAVTCVLIGTSPVQPVATTGPRDHPLCLAHCGRDLPFAARSFDLVILHDSLDRLIRAESAMREGTALIELLGRIRGVLAVDGVVAGCAANRMSLRRWRRRKFKSPEPSEPARSSRTLSIRSCRNLLGRSGFVDIETFSILPSADSPMRLINTQADLSRRGFRRELEAIHESLSPFGYLLRRAFVQLALNRFFEDSFLFWGRAK